LAVGVVVCDRDEGRINVRSRWKEYGPSVEDDEVYLAVKKNASGSRPKELFEDLIVVSGWGLR
jgi:pre-mRNA-processing factor 40